MNPVHTIDTAGGFAQPDRVTMGIQNDVANLIGAGAGLSVVTAVVFTEPVELPYNVQVTPNQDAVAFVSAKTRTGFNLTLFPRLAADTLAVGTNDVLITK